MKKQTRSLLNIILFQIGWWACFLMASRGISLWFLLAVVILLVGTHFSVVVQGQGKSRELLFYTLLGLCGYLMDSLFTYFGVLSFTHSFSIFGPLWLLGMWFVFPMSIGYSFSWLKNRYLLTFVLGALGGPLTYRFGESFGLIRLNEMVPIIIYGLYWGLFLNLAVIFKEKPFFTSYSRS